MTTQKTSVGFRLSEQALQHLETITRATGTTKTATVETSLALMANKFKGDIKMTAREFYDTYIFPEYGDEMSFEEALELLTAYTSDTPYTPYTERAVNYTQFPDANLPLADDEDDFLDFLDNFIEWFDC